MSRSVPQRSKVNDDFWLFDGSLVNNMNNTPVREDYGRLKVIDSETVVEEDNSIIWDVEAERSHDDEVRWGTGGASAQ